MEFGEVEALFTETNPSRPNNVRANVRLDELCRAGCNQKIAWSKLGCIAIINNEGTGVETRHLACNPDDGKWCLSDAYSVANVSRTHKGQRLQHVTWSSHGAELAVIDVLGRISFYTVFLAINQLTLSSVHAPHPDDDLSALVGFWWLPTERPYSLHATTRTSEGFKYSSQTFKPYGPFHPVAPKPAAIGITRGGAAKLWFHDKTSNYIEVTCDLESLTSLDDVFSHAAISFNKDNIAVIAAYTQSRQLRVYRLAINWNITPPQQPNKTPIFPTSPVLLTKRVKLIPSALSPESAQGSLKTHILHIEILGPRSSVGGEVPTILCIFLCLPDDRPQFTVISRWEVRDSPSALHPSFYQLNVRRASISSPVAAELDLHKLDDVLLDKPVLGMWSVTSGTVVTFALSDGSLDFRDRNTLQRVERPPTDGKITNMIQAGFSFVGGQPCIDMVLSPNNTVAVRLSHSHEVSLSVVEFTNGPMDVKENVDFACATLATQHAYSCSNYLNNDDLLLVARNYRSLEFNNAFLTEVHRALNLKMDFAAESPSDRLIRNPILQRCLSLQYALNFRGEKAARTVAGKVAWATLHLRVASLAFGLTWNPTTRRPGGAGTLEDGGTKPEALQTLLGLVRWFVDTMSLIIGDLIELAKATKGRTDDLQFVRQKMVESNSPALLLTLASAPRAFLRYNCRSLRGLETSTGKQLQSGLFDEEQRMTFRSFKVPIDSCAVKIQLFEKIMGDIDGTVRAAYHNVSEAERATAERLLFVNNEIPPIFKEPVARLLNIAIPNLRESINLSSLFWHDVSWLGLHDDISSRLYHRTHRIDAVRKIILPSKAVKLRRCTRCCAVVEEANTNKNPGHWLHSTYRMCFCGTLWMHLD